MARGARDAVQLFGTDYDTPDGTCVRDYVHVADVADAHVRCLEAIDALGADAFNLGNGAGYSNRQVIDAVQRVTGCPVVVVPAARRAGDPARLVASADRIYGRLGWRPQVTDLDAMIHTAWQWQLRLDAGRALART